MKKEIRNLNIHEDTITNIIKNNKNNPKIMFRLIRCKLSKDQAIKVLFSLFKDRYKYELIEMEDEIKKCSKQLEEETGWQVVNRNEIRSYDVEREKVYRVVRKARDFYPMHNGGESYSSQKEFSFWAYNYKLLYRLGDTLFAEELKVEMALVLGLKNPKDEEFARQLADYLGMLVNVDDKYPIKRR